MPGHDEHADGARLVRREQLVEYGLVVLCWRLLTLLLALVHTHELPRLVSSTMRPEHVSKWYADVE